MTTHRTIVDALFHSANELESVVLSTVVRITGSSYGGVGARMVARVDGTTVGIVSGGCLESDLAEHAREVHASHQPRVVTYDTRADDETAWGLGLGCNGLIDVLLEPLNPVEAAAVGRLLEQALASEEPSVMATVIAAPKAEDAPSIGAHALMNGETIETSGDWGNRAVLDLAKEIVSEAHGAGRRGLVREFGDAAVSFEIVKPAVRLVVCGGGPDVVPLVRLGRELGWNLTVVDHRPVTDDHQARLPGALLIECPEPEAIGDCVSLTPATAVVVMSHNYARDLQYVRALIASGAGYIGVLGPRARTERMLAELTELERARAADRLFGPIGLDLGGDGPEAIALSIVAEVSAVLARRGGGHLRDRSEPLHD